MAGPAMTRVAAVQSWPLFQKPHRRMFSTAFSRSASSKTMTGALPPSSRCSRLTESAALRAMRLPVSVSPVTETMATAGCSDQRVADVLAAAGDDVEDPWRQDVGRDLRQGEGRQRRPDGGLEDDRVAGRQRRADLPAGHVEGIVPGWDGGHDAHRVAPDERGVAGQVLVGGLALHDARGTREEAQVVDHGRDLVDSHAQWLPAVAGSPARPAPGPGPRPHRRA